MPSESPTSAISTLACSSCAAKLASYAVSITILRPSVFIACKLGTVTGLRAGALAFSTYTAIPSMLQCCGEQLSGAERLTLKRGIYSLAYQRFVEARKPCPALESPDRALRHAAAAIQRRGRRYA